MYLLILYICLCTHDDLRFAALCLSCNIDSIIKNGKNCEYCMKSTIKLLSICFVTLALVGCGLKGPLYRPVEKTAMQQAKLTTASIQSDLFI